MELAVEALVHVEHPSQTSYESTSLPQTLQNNTTEPLRLSSPQPSTNEPDTSTPENSALVHSANEDTVMDTTPDNADSRAQSGSGEGEVEHSGDLSAPAAMETDQTNNDLPAELPNAPEPSQEVTSSTEPETVESSNVDNNPSDVSQQTSSDDPVPQQANHSDQSQEDDEQDDKPDEEDEEEEEAPWAGVEEDTSTPDEEELKKIEADGDRSALDCMS